MANTIYNPFTGADEVVVRDERGNLTVVRADATVPPPSVPPTGSPLRPISPPPLPPSLPARPLSVDGDLDDVVTQLAAAAGVVLTQPTLVRRLTNAVLSRVKDIRSPIEVHELLVRPVAIGGLGLDAAAADKLERIIELQLPKLTGRHWLVPPPPVTPPKPTPAVAPSAPPAVSPVRPPSATLAVTPTIPVRPAPLPTPPQTQRPPAAPPPPPTIPKPAPPSATSPAAFVRPPAPVIPKPAMPADLPPATPRPAPVAPAAASAPGSPPSPRGRTQLVGPVDELGRFTIVDFRRLDLNPVLAAGKIRALFGALERESFASRAAGLAAWRSSDLYALYTAMGQESLTMKQPIEAVAAARQTQGQPALTVAEFEAIMDLNQQLRF